MTSSYFNSVWCYNSLMFTYQHCLSWVTGISATDGEFGSNDVPGAQISQEKKYTVGCVPYVDKISLDEYISYQIYYHSGNKDIWLYGIIGTSVCSLPVDGLVHEKRISIANALELRPSCINPSIEVYYLVNRPIEANAFRAIVVIINIGRDNMILVF